VWSKNKKRQTCDQKIGKDKHVIKKLKTNEWSKNKKDKSVIDFYYKLDSSVNYVQEFYLIIIEEIILVW
jgi:poly-beta-hydroxyalkanoate depolymerase